MWREFLRELAAPLDGDDAIACEVVVEAQRSKFGRGFDAVEVHVDKRKAASVVFVDEGECGAGDLARVAAECLCEALDEAGFACAHGAFEAQDGVRSEAGGEILRGLAGVLLGRAEAFPAREGFFDLRVCHEGWNLVRSFAG